MDARVDILPDRGRLASLPPAARPSAEHLRALAAAAHLDVQLLKKFAQRPLMSVWSAQDAAGTKHLLTAVDACRSTDERDRMLGAAKALAALPAGHGVQGVHQVAEEEEAFLQDYFGAGTAADIAVLRWSPLRRLEFMIRVCEALAALHANAIVHGCLCPDNILLNDALSPVLTEAGMVSVAESLGGDPESFFGYGAYAAPEAVTGRADALSDVYSAGQVLLFVMLDETPGEAMSLASIGTRLPELAPIIRRCTTSPEARYASMTELVADLRACRQRLAHASDVVRHPTQPPAPRAPSGEAAARPSPPTAGRAPASASPRWVAAAAAVAFVACVVGAAALPLSTGVQMGLEALAGVCLLAMSSAVPARPALRVALTVVALIGAVVGDPVARVSRTEAGDSDVRGAAVRALVASGGKDLRRKRLPGADLSGLDLVGADLTGADFTSASFRGAKLVRAVTDGTSFIRASFLGADLSSVALEQSYGIETASCDEATVLPAGWSCNPEGRIRRSAR
jgi:hypothetical protein